MNIPRDERASQRHDKLDMSGTCLYRSRALTLMIAISPSKAYVNVLLAVLKVISVLHSSCVSVTLTNTTSVVLSPITSVDVLPSHRAIPEHFPIIDFQSRLSRSL